MAIMQEALHPIDYNVCQESETGKHGPLQANYDPEIQDTHVSVMCMSCGLSTGFPIDDFAGQLEWN